MDLNITSPKIIVEPLGSNSSIIKIKAVNDIPSESLPSTQIPVIKATASMLRQVFFGNISSGLKSNSLTENITTSFSNLTIKLLQPLTFTDQFETFWKSFGGLITLIGGGFGAGFSALLINKLKKTRGNSLY